MITARGYVSFALASVAIIAAVGSADFSNRNPTERTVSEIQYFRDPRVDLCFAVSGASITHIPCEMPRGRVASDSRTSRMAWRYVSEMQYARDQRSGLCFGVHYGEIAQVPCDAVQSQLVQVRSNSL